MYNILTLNKIAACGTDRFDGKYTCSDCCENPTAVMVRSASMHETVFSPETLAIARAGAGGVIHAIQGVARGFVAAGFGIQINGGIMDAAGLFRQLIV